MHHLRRQIPLAIAIIVRAIGFHLVIPRGIFLSTNNMIDLMLRVSINALLAFGMTKVILLGGIDLSVGAVVALSGTIAVSLLPSCGWFIASLAGLSAAGVVGLFNGVCAAKTSIPPFIITLATMRIVRGLAYMFNEGRPISIADSETVFRSFGGRLFDVLPMPVFFMTIAFVLMTWLLHFTAFGQHLFAIGGNREAARLVGIPMARREIMVYVLSALLAGVAGLIQASELYAASPDSGQGFELDAIAAVVVGGTSFTSGMGSMPGTLLGAIIIGILDKGLNQASVHFSVQYVVKGLVILIAVFFDVRRRGKQKA